ncbi:MAG: helix-turn-helix transcriptional regulator [Clostridiales bacterium]|nr:helix-turn-helix transcriptional regulator [Clostridiales bacterium]
MDIRDRIVELRHNKKLKQSEFADAINISPSSVSLWEKGDRRPDIEVIKIICKKFDVTADYLLGLSDIPKPYIISDTDPMLKEIVESWNTFSLSNKHRLYADCLEYLENQENVTIDTDKRKKERRAAQGEN